MQRKIWDGEIHLCHTQEFMLVGEVWNSEMGKECLSKVCLLQRDRDMGPSCEKENCRKAYLVDMEELFEFEHSCP